MPDTFSSTNMVDFYFLEAMMDRAKRLPEAPLPSLERWRSDLERQYGPFVKGFAAAVRDYLFLSCMGEARHGYAYAWKHFPELGNGSRSRSEAYQDALAFSPERNLDKLAAFFNELSWHEEGYGSTNWGAIASAIRLYGQVPAEVFLDLVIAIEHNNGNVFNKVDAVRAIPFKCDMDFYYKIQEFLGYKTKMDILSKPAYLQWLSRETLSLLVRYCHVVSRKDAPRNAQTLLGQGPPRLPKEHESPWGNETLGQLEESPEGEDTDDDEEIQTEEIYDGYTRTVSATPKMPRGEHPDL